MKQRVSVYALSIVVAVLTAAACAQGPQRVDVALVVDFENKSTEMGEQLARLATDSVAVELAATNRFEVLRRDEIARETKQLGLRTPLDSIARRKLAKAMGATVILDGSIEFVRDDVRAKPRTISVGLIVRVTDVESGELIAGAAQVGFAKYAPEYTDKNTLITEALRSVTISAPRAALAQAIPEGIIMSSDTFGRARGRMINRGLRHGVRKGMKFMVMREGIRIGTAEATKVNAMHSEVRILEGDNLARSEDRVRAIGQIIGKLN